MILPPYVIVGPYKYRIIDMSAEDFDEEEGGCNHNNLVIKVYTQNRAPEFVLDTLWHEISHAVNHVADVNDETKEEDQVTRTTPVWLQVIRDNHGLWNVLDHYRRSAMDDLPIKQE